MEWLLLIFRVLLLFLFLLLLASQSLVELASSLKWRLIRTFLWGGIASPMSHPQPRGPECSFFSGSSPLTLYGMGGPISSYATVSISLRII